jgi:acetyl esterase/lipase
VKDGRLSRLLQCAGFNHERSLRGILLPVAVVDWLESQGGLAMLRGGKAMLVRTLGLVAIAGVLVLASQGRMFSAMFGPVQAAAPSGQQTYAYVPDTVSAEAQALLRRYRDPSTGRAMPAPDDLEGWKREQQEAEAASRAASDAAVARYQATVTPRELGGVPVLELKPRGWQDNGKVLVYLHGGAYTFYSARSSLNISLPVADATGLRTISVDYTLAPQAKWEQTTDQVGAVLQALVSEGHRWQDLAVWGDSSGGGLAPGSVLKLRDRGLGMPAAVVLWSPWADITDTGDTYVTLARADPSLFYPGQLERAADAYADPRDQKHPYVSPVYADFGPGFPPTLIQGGTKEIFLSNFVRLYRALDAAGVPVILDLYEGMPHVFQFMLIDAPEGQTALKKTAEFLRRHLTP